MAHAVRNARWVLPHPSRDDVLMFIGPDYAGQWLEVGVVDTEDGPLAIHAMPAREKYLRLIRHDT
jgi:hypothetical protein